MTAARIRVSVLSLAALLLLGGGACDQPATDRAEADAEPTNANKQPAEEEVVTVDGTKVQYLEIVTPAVDETVAALSAAHEVVFGEPIAELGNARTADLAAGGRIGVRAPMSAMETPVVRPYILVDDIAAAVEAAMKAGATVALPPTEIPGQGTFAIYILGGIEHGLWQL